MHDLSAPRFGDFFEMADVASRVEKPSKLYRLGLKDEKFNIFAGMPLHCG
jgi:hypothetical protein